METAYDHTATFELDGVTYRGAIWLDPDGGFPWEEGDGYGYIEHTRYKAPGQVVLTTDRWGEHIVYDVQKTQKLAIRDSWSAEPHDEGSRRERAARAVAKDMRRCRGFLEGEWHWCGIILERLCPACGNWHEVDDGAHSLWGIESDAGDYLFEVAQELAASASLHCAA